MTGASMTIQRDDPLILSERLAEYFRPYPAKVLARTINCTESTAENFRLARTWPSARHWKLIVQAFGRDVISCVFEPEINDTLARLEREARQLEARLAEVHARRRAAAGDLESYPERRSQAVAEPLPLTIDLFEDCTADARQSA